MYYVPIDRQNSGKMKKITGNEKNFETFVHVQTVCLCTVKMDEFLSTIYLVHIVHCGGVQLHSPLKFPAGILSGGV